MELKEFLNENIKTPQIDKVITSTPYSNFVKKRMNEIGDNYHTLYILANFISFVWAQDNNSYEIVDIYYDGNERKTISFHTLCIKSTSDIINIFNNSVNLLLDQKQIDVIKAIHFSHLEKTEITKRKVEYNYIDALDGFVKLVSKDVDFIINNLKTNLLEINAQQDISDTLFVLHNTNLLLDIYNRLDEDDHSKLIDYVEIKNIINKYANTLNTYPIETEHLDTIVKMRINGFKEQEIADKINKSRTYVRDKHKFGSELMSYLLWGVGCKQLINV